MLDDKGIIGILWEQLHVHALVSIVDSDGGRFHVNLIAGERFGARTLNPGGFPQYTNDKEEVHQEMAVRLKQAAHVEVRCIIDGDERVRTSSRNAEGSWGSFGWL